MNRKGERRKFSKPGHVLPRIFPQFVGHTLAVHDGKRHVPVYISESMVGQQTRGVCPTRLFPWPRQIREEFQGGGPPLSGTPGAEREIAMEVVAKMKYTG
jgi:hypothetical protein